MIEQFNLMNRAPEAPLLLVYYINHISTLICTFLENLKKNGQEMKATQKNFQSLLLNDYKSVKMRFDFVYDYPRPFSNTKYQKNGQKKIVDCVCLQYTPQSPSII